MSFAEPDPAFVATLTSMGFSEDDSRIALRRTNNDVNHAVELLSQGKGAFAKSLTIIFLRHPFFPSSLFVLLSPFSAYL